MYKAYPLVFPSKDTEVVASCFVADLHARMPSICGEPLRYSSKALMPFAQLHSATSYTALSNAKPVPVKTSLRPPGVSVPFRHVTAASSSTPAEVPQVGPGNVLQSDKNTQPCQLVPSFICRTQANSGGRVVPTFQPKSFNSSQNWQPPSSKEETRTNAAIVPTFKPTFPSRGAPPSQPQKRAIQSTNELVPNLVNTLLFQRRPENNRPQVQNHQENRELKQVKCLSPKNKGVELCPLQPKGLVLHPQLLVCSRK